MTMLVAPKWLLCHEIGRTCIVEKQLQKQNKTKETKNKQTKAKQKNFKKAKKKNPNNNNNNKKSIKNNNNNNNNSHYHLKYSLNCCVLKLIKGTTLSNEGKTQNKSEQNKNKTKSNTPPHNNYNNLYLHQASARNMFYQPATFINLALFTNSSGCV